jgi:hypothetical protein
VKKPISKFAFQMQPAALYPGVGGAAGAHPRGAAERGARARVRRADRAAQGGAVYTLNAV